MHTLQRCKKEKINKCEIAEYFNKIRIHFCCFFLIHFAVYIFYHNQ